MNFWIKETNIDLEFEKLANQLLLQEAFIVNSQRIRFTEIEFYYYSEKHKDAFTHSHEMDSGKWRLHNQGLDITLKGDSGFGGILIRGISIENRILNKTDYFNGPRRVLFEIMKHLNTVNEVKNDFGLIEIERSDLKIYKTFRHGLNTPNNELNTDEIEIFKNANYRFITNPREFKKNQFSDSEKIARSFNDKNLAFEFLGYKLNS